MNHPKQYVNDKLKKKVPAAESISLQCAQQIYYATKYQIGESIGNGSFGEVYKCARYNNSNDLVAIKVEHKSIAFRQLRLEYNVYQNLRGGEGIPNVRCFGTTDEYDYMVMDLLGPSLEALFNYCGRRFTVCTTFMLATKIISLIEYVHENHYIHRDIKPENLVVGPGNAVDQLFLIDFGLSKQYIAANGVHIPYKTDRSFIGTARYASINSQRHVTQSRRDDMESIGYVLVYFLKGSLPWQNKRSAAENPKQRKERILEMKVSTPISALCANLPFELQFYMKYCRERPFDEKPNYAYLRRLFSGTVVQRTIGENNNQEFDWVILDRNEQQKTNDSLQSETYFPIESIEIN